MHTKAFVCNTIMQESKVVNPNKFETKNAFTQL